MLTAPQRRLVAEHAGLGDQATRHLRHEDRQSIANLAVTEAAARWDPSNGVPFPTFAARRARGAVADRERTDLRMRRRHLTILRVIELAGHTHTPTVEAAQACGLDPAELDQARAARHRATMVRLDQPSPEEDGTLGDVLAVVPDHAQAVVDRLVLVQAVGRLDDRHRRLVVLRFFAGWPHAVIARMFGVTDSAVSHMQRTALDRLRCDLLAT